MSIHKLHSSFNAGELSPLMDSRVNVEKYDAGCRRLRNFILHTHGPVFRRPGMEYMGDEADHLTASRFIEFNFSATTTFVIEMTVGVFRFWHNGSLVTKSVIVEGAPKTVEVTATHDYLPEEFFEVQCKQVNDVCYLAHKNHPPMKLVRLADDDWRCEEVPFRYPPLLDEYVEKETLTTPTVTELYESALEEAPEFTLTPRAESEIPIFTVAARPAGTTAEANQWFQLHWEWGSPLTGHTGKTLTVEVQKATGEWVPLKSSSVDLAVALLNATTLATYEFRFKVKTPPSKSLVAERRLSTGTGGWSSVELANFFGAAQNSAPDLTFRVVYGPALVNDIPDHEAVVSVFGEASGALLESPYNGKLPLIHHLQTPTSEDIIATWTLPGFVPTGKILTWQIINSENKWAKLWAWGDAGFPIAPALNGTSGIYRVRIKPTGEASLEHKHADGYWVARGTEPMTKAVSCKTTLGMPTITMTSTAGRIVGETVKGAGIPSGTTVIGVTSATILTLSHNSTATSTAVTLIFTRPTPWNVRLLYGPESLKGIGTQVVTCNIASGLTLVTLAGTTPTHVRRVGELVSGPGIPAGTTISSITSSTQLTISNEATVTNTAVNLTFTAPAHVTLTAAGLTTQEVKLERQKSGPDGDAATSAVTVPAGDWRARVAVPAGAEVPSGAKVTLEKWVPNGTGGAWSTPISTMNLQAGVTKEYVGQLKGAFTTPTLVRARYNGGRRTAGKVTIDRVVFPARKAVTLEVSSTIGTGTMTAKDSSDPAQPYGLFVAGHKDSHWQIVHRRELSSLELTGSGFSAEGIRVSGSWDIFTYGTWTGTLHLERRGPSHVWQVIRSWTSKDDRNVIASGHEDEDVNLRLRAVLTSSSSPRFVLEAADSRTYGLVKITEVTVPEGESAASEVQVEIVRPLAATTPTTLWAEGAWSELRGYPAAVTMHEARLWFGGSKHQPQTLWASVSSDFENFRRSTLDDGSLALTLAAEVSNSILWMNSATALLIGTGGEEWALRSGTEGAGISATNVRVERQSGYSSMPLGAKLAHEVTVFVQRDGRRVRQLSFTDAQQSFTAGDLTVLAPHVTAGGVRQLAFQQAPTAILWVVTNEGKLAGMTFEREQNVFGWHIHETDGEIETVAVLHGTPADEVWVGVRRTVVLSQRDQCGIEEGSAVVSVPSTTGRKVGESVAGNGIPDGAVIAELDVDAKTVTLSHEATSTKADADLKFTTTERKRHVERMQPQAMAADWREQHTLIYADSARLHEFETPQREITGLRHLEGRECVILADGLVHRRMAVDNETLMLDVAARKVVVGLPYSSELQPMKQEVEMQDGTAQGRRFKLHGVTVRMDHSLGGEVSANADDATLPWARMPSAIVMGEATPLFSGERDVILDSRHEAAVNLTVRQRDPLPLNLTALVLRFDVHGN